jgi:hypothetical protein
MTVRDHNPAVLCADALCRVLYLSTPVAGSKAAETGLGFDIPISILSFCCADYELAPSL